jgi:hypothetical protein
MNILLKSTFPNQPPPQKFIRTNKDKMLGQPKLKTHTYLTQKPIKIMESKLNSYMLQQLMQDKYTLIRQADFLLFQAKETNTS